MSTVVGSPNEIQGGTKGQKKGSGKKTIKTEKTDFLCSVALHQARIIKQFCSNVNGCRKPKRNSRRNKGSKKGVRKKNDKNRKNRLPLLCSPASSSNN